MDQEAINRRLAFAEQQWAQRAARQAAEEAHWAAVNSRPTEVNPLRLPRVVREQLFCPSSNRSFPVLELV